VRTGVLTIIDLESGDQVYRAEYEGIAAGWGLHFVSSEMVRYQAGYKGGAGAISGFLNLNSLEDFTVSAQTKLSPWVDSVNAMLGHQAYERFTNDGWERQHQFSRLDLSDGTLSEIATVPSSDNGFNQFTPSSNGEYIAYMGPVELGEFTLRPHLLSISDGTVVELSDFSGSDDRNARSDVMIRFTADSEYVVYTNDEEISGTVDLFAVSIAGDDPGKPVRLTPDDTTGVDSFKVYPSGSTFYGRAPSTSFSTFVPQ
jgi:hypothetical protein